MNEITVIPDQAVSAEGKTTSVMVAGVFRKQHKDVLRSINNLELPDEWARRNFAPRDYTDSRGKQQPMYEITRDGFTMLAMGFTGSEAMKFKMAYIMAFNRMEKQVAPSIQPGVPQTLPDALEAYAKTLREKEVLQLQAAADKPKVWFTDAIEMSEGSILIRDLAKDLNSKLGVDTGGHRLFAWMRKNGYLTKKNEPTQVATDLGVLEVLIRVVGSGPKAMEVRTTKVTGKGQIYFFGKFSGKAQ